MKVLITGGLGFIGSHTVVDLANKGHECVIADNSSYGGLEVFGRMQKISEYPIRCRVMNLMDREQLADVFKKNRFDAVIHLNETRAVDESMENPLLSHEDMISSTTNLVQEMKTADVKRIIYSSAIPVGQDSTSFGWNPYDYTNSIIEEMLNSLAYTDSKWRIAVMKYATPAGAHSSGMIGDDPSVMPSNLLSFIAQVASGRRQLLDLPGEESRQDFIHVMDLANMHDLALKYMVRQAGSQTFNISTGKDYSALEVVRAFEEVNGVEIPYQITDKHLDTHVLKSVDLSETERKLNWTAERGLRELCEDAWRWEKESKKLLLG